SRSCLFVVLLRRLSASLRSSLFLLNAPATPESYTLSLHDALPISGIVGRAGAGSGVDHAGQSPQSECRGGSGLWGLTSMVNAARSEEHTSELQSRSDLVCRLLLEKKKT